MDDHITTLLRRIRIARGLTQSDLAAAVPCARMTVWRLESGQQKTAHPRVRLGLERALGVPFDLLMTLDTKNTPAPKGEGAGGPNAAVTHTTESSEAYCE